MVQCVCFVQAGQIADEVIDDLGRGIDRIAREMLSANDVELVWIQVPTGYGWSAGAPSTTSVVTMTAPPMAQSHRADVLKAICELWTTRTGCSVAEILAAVLPMDQERIDATVSV